MPPHLKKGSKARAKWKELGPFDIEGYMNEGKLKLGEGSIQFYKECNGKVMCYGQVRKGIARTISKERD